MKLSGKSEQYRTKALFTLHRELESLSGWFAENELVDIVDIVDDISIHSFDNIACLQTNLSPPGIGGYIGDAHPFFAALGSYTIIQKKVRHLRACAIVFSSRRWVARRRHVVWCGAIPGGFCLMLLCFLPV